MVVVDGIKSKVLSSAKLKELPSSVFPSEEEMSSEERGASEASEEEASSEELASGSDVVSPPEEEAISEEEESMGKEHPTRSGSKRKKGSFFMEGMISENGDDI